MKNISIFNYVKKIPTDRIFKHEKSSEGLSPITLLRELLVLCVLIFTLIFSFIQPTKAQFPIIQQALKEQETADSLSKSGQYRQAILHSNKGLNLLQKMLPVPYPELVKLHRMIGYYYRQLGQYHQSETFQKKAIELAEKGLPEYHSERMRAYNAMGIFLLATGDYTLAKKYFNKAILISRAKFPDQAAQHLNNLGIANERLGRYEDASTNYTESLQFNKDQFGLYSIQTTTNFFNLGTLSFNTGNIDLAINYFDSTLLVYDSILPANDIEFASLFNNIGTTYHRKGDLRKALDYLYKAQALMEANYGTNHPELAHTYTNIGLLHFERGDLGQALSYLQRALQIRTENFDSNHPLIARTNYYLALVLIEKGELDGAYEKLRTAKTIYDKINSYDPKEYAQVLSEFGTYFEHKNNPKLAIEYYQRALKSIQAIDQSDPTESAVFLRKVGALLAKAGKQTEAIPYLDKSLKIFTSSFGSKHPEVGTTYEAYATAYHDDNQLAEEYLTKACNSYGYDPGSKNFQNLNAPIALINTLQQWVDLKLELYEKSKDQSNLLLAKNKSDEAIALIKYITSYLEEAASRQTLLDNYFKVYEKAILTEFYLWTDKKHDKTFLESAFEISEKSNAALLVEALRAVDARYFAGIPESTLMRERQLKIDIAYLEKSQFEEGLKGSNANNKRLNEIAETLFEKKRAYNTLQKQIVSSYPTYYKLRYEAPTVSINDLQQKILKTDENLVSFFTGEENIFVFVINRDSVSFSRIAKDFPLENWVEEFCNSIYHFNPGSEDFDMLSQKFNNIGNELYKLIFQPIETSLQGNKLVIIPSGVLGYLPFEALLTNTSEDYNDFGKQSYLIQQYQISYNYSATQLFETVSKRTSGKGNLQFAPSYNGDTLKLSREVWDMVLYKLKYNQEEAIKVNKLIGGKLFIDSLATRSSFINYAPTAQLIHLATHGKANDQNGEFSYLAFHPTSNDQNDELLFVKDLYNLHLEADMVVLSACETGIGEYQRGEGILSLARGFLFAGAASIVTTLWSVDDRASSQIVEDFYKNLKEGQDKDEALRHAKLTYLNKYKGSNRSHPLFWAAFVPVGKMDSIPVGFHHGWLLIIGLLVAVFVWFSILRKKSIARP